MRPGGSGGGPKRLGGGGGPKCLDGGGPKCLGGDGPKYLGSGHLSSTTVLSHTSVLILSALADTGYIQSVKAANINAIHFFILLTL